MEIQINLPSQALEAAQASCVDLLAARTLRKALRSSLAPSCIGSRNSHLPSYHSHGVKTSMDPPPSESAQSHSSWVLK